MYLASLSASDLMVLIFYVLTEWLARGLPVLSPGAQVSFLEVSGICHVIMYFHYVSRFLSAWLVVAFTIERYIGVCHPLQRRHICSAKSTRKIVFGLVIFSLVVNMYKPLLSKVQEIHPSGGLICTTDSQFQQLSFVLDSVYAVFITFVPFVIITSINSLIIRRLVRHNRQQRLYRSVTEESILRLEFTVILLVVSFFFVALNFPYFAVWCMQFMESRLLFQEGLKLSNTNQILDLQRMVYITKAVFYVNYCINFFLYSITGAFFRRQLVALFRYKNEAKKRELFQQRQYSPCQGNCLCQGDSNRQLRIGNVQPAENYNHIYTPRTWMWHGGGSTRLAVWRLIDPDWHSQNVLKTDL